MKTLQKLKFKEVSEATGISLTRLYNCSKKNGLELTQTEKAQIKKYLQSLIEEIK